MLKGFVVTVVRRLEEKVPVMAENIGQAMEIMENLIEERDMDFIFEGVDESETEYYVRKVEEANGKEFDRLREECETVRPDGEHKFE